MLRNIISLALLMIIMNGCADREVKSKEQPEKIYFSRFEISYEGGWFGGFSFLADSTKIFFSPPVYPQGIDDNVKYGILPDTIFNMLNKTAYQLQTDTSIKSRDTHCDDCGALSIRVINKNDTIQFFQRGVISHPWDLITPLSTFLRTQTNSYFNALMILETARNMAVMPPKVEEK